MRVCIPVISILLLQSFQYVSANRGRKNSDCSAPANDDDSPSRRRRHERQSPGDVLPGDAQPGLAVGDYLVQEFPPSAPVFSSAPRSRNCTDACQYRNKLKDVKLEFIKEDILRKLRLSKPPNRTMSNVPAIPGQMERILEKFGMVSDQPTDQPSEEPYYNGDDYHSTTSFVFNFGKTPPPEKRNPHFKLDSVTYFDLKSITLTSSVVKATLGLYVRRPPRDGVLKFTPMMIDKIVSGTEESSCRFKYKKINLNRRGTNKWYTFDVTKMVQNWFTNSSSNFGLHIQSDRINNRSLVVIQPGADQRSYMPYLELELKTTGNSRQKRNLININCHNDSTEKRCCRYKLEVDFEQFQWDWIIAPKRYQAYFCSGDCDFTFMQKYPHSHVVQQIVGTGGVGGPCCAPVKFSPISMLYFDDHNNIVYGTLPGMVVDRCGCS